MRLGTLTIPYPQYWNAIYRAKDAKELSWYRSTPGPSLAALDRLNLGTGQRSWGSSWATSA